MTAVIAFSRTGCKTALKAAQVLGAEVLYAPQRIAQSPFAPITKPFREFYGKLFQTHSVLIFVGSVGIAVREIAPHVRSKDRLVPAVGGYLYAQRIYFPG